MPVRFRCPCGAILNADEKHIDSVKPCPQCHLNLRIPHAPSPRLDCVMCKQPIPSSHTIWVRGRRLCWHCMPPGSVRLDMNGFHEHRKLQLETIRKAQVQGLHHFQYHSPFETAYNEVQNTADELVFEDKQWDKVTPKWRELGLVPFDMGSFMGVSLNVERFRAQEEESRKYLEPLLAYVKLSDELPLASVPKEGVASSAAATAANPSGTH